MSKSTVVRWLVVSVLTLAVLVPAAPLVASGDSPSEEGDGSAASEQGVIEEVVDWILDLVSTSDPEAEGDGRPEADPNG